MALFLFPLLTNLGDFCSSDFCSSRISTEKGFSLERNCLLGYCGDMAPWVNGAKGW
jgi:hypothetical protein